MHWLVSGWTTRDGGEAMVVGGTCEWCLDGGECVLMVLPHQSQPKVSDLQHRVHL